MRTLFFTSVLYSVAMKFLVKTHMLFDDPIDKVFLARWMCREIWMTLFMYVQIWKFQSLVKPTFDPLPPFGLFGACTTPGYCPGFDKRGYSAIYGICSDFLGGLGLVRSACNFFFFLFLAAIGSYKAVNSSIHGVTFSVHMCFEVSLILSFMRISSFFILVFFLNVCLCQNYCYMEDSQLGYYLSPGCVIILLP